jgi:hypothetical protein
MLDFLDLFSGYFVKVSSFGEELPYQAVGVFIGSPFPGTARMGEIHFNFCLAGKQFVLGHLSALVIGKSQLHLAGHLLNFSGK